MIFFALALLCTGGIVALVSGIWTLALAFQRHPAWGVAVCFVPVGNVAFLIANPREARAPFLLGVWSVLLMGTALFTMPKESLAFPVRSALQALHLSQVETKAAAEAKMAAARALAEDEFRLHRLKAEETLLAARKAALPHADHAAAEQLTADIARYNSELTLVIPGRLVAR